MSTDSIPTVSIGFPVYNGEKYLAQALESVLSQTYDDLEVIICDNASTDATEEICRAFADRDPRVRYVRNRRNLGLVGNFNKAFDLARGRYFKWNAYDDFCAPSLIERCVEALEASPDALCAYSLATQVDDDGVVADVRKETALIDELASGQPSVRIRATLLRNGWNGVIHGLFRRAALARFMPYKEYFGADRLILTELATAGRMVAVESGLFLQRYHASNTSRHSTRDIARLLTGEEPHGIIFPAGRAFVDYARLFMTAPLKPTDRLRALAYLLRHGLRGDVLRNLIIPGPHNYFGLDPAALRTGVRRRSKNPPPVLGEKGSTIIHV